LTDDVSASGDFPPLLIVVSGPSGVGKDAVLARVRERAPAGERFAVPVTMTTRAPRDGEVDGVDYLFVTAEEFQRRLEAGELLEHAEVYGHSYGVPRSQLRDALASGRDAIVHVDVQGVATLRRLLPGALFLFLVPNDMRQLERRLRERGGDEETMRRRLDAAQREMAERAHFDQVVENVEGDLDGTADRVLAIVRQERARPGRRPVEV
jgi:guanylate kinase